LKKVIRYSTS